MRASCSKCTSFAATGGSCRGDRALPADAAVVTRALAFRERNRQLELVEVRVQPLLQMGVDANPMPVAALNATNSPTTRDEQRLGALVRSLGLEAN